jgi:hypothetical protein
LAGIIAYALISDYKPREKEELFESNKPDMLSDSIEISLFTWNIGYCGLDKEMDFSMTEGSKYLLRRINALATFQWSKIY